VYCSSRGQLLKKTIVSAKSLAHMIAPSLLPLQLRDLQTLYLIWEALLENYSGRVLTYELDRIMALDRIIRVLGDMIHRTVTIGFLRSKFHQQPMWHVNINLSRESSLAGSH